MTRSPAVYILASSRKGTLYTGVRGRQHQEHVIDGFSKRYDVTRLVWYESTESMEGAILREKQIKKWNREWKIRLIEERNPDWKDLWPEIMGHAQVAGFPPSRE